MEITEDTSFDSFINTKGEAGLNLLENILNINPKNFCNGSRASLKQLAKVKQKICFLDIIISRANKLPNIKNN